MDRFIDSENEADAPSADSFTKRKTPSIDSTAPVVPGSPVYSGLKHPRRYSIDPELPPLRENEAELTVDIAGSIESVNDGELDSNGYGRLELESDLVVLDGLSFRLVCFLTRRLDEKGAPYYELGLYVKVSPPVDDSGSWSYRSVSMMVMLVNSNNPYSDDSKVCRDTCQFSSNDPCRGWSSIVSFSSITDLEDQGFVFNSGLIKARGQVSFEGSAIVIPQDYSVPYSGLENMGATCYLAALLQSLFHIGSFRELVYTSPCADDSDILSALQCVFSDLEESDRSGVSAEPLTHAFGWDLADVGVQHDAQELNRILIDRIESMHKDQITALFSGELENYIECLDVEYTSRRVEKFYDLQMNLISHNYETGEAKPITSLQEAIDQYLTPEILDGPNMYDAESFGKQRARKGVRFVSLPPVLSFQLMRFQFDYETLEMKKLNTKFSFPQSLVLSGSNYVLHSVLVHSGNVHAGHYYAYVRPDGRTDWFKFDDTEVRKVDSFTAVENNFGGHPIVCDKLVNYLHSDEPTTTTGRDKVYSAYMLTYVRSDMVSTVLVDFKFSDLSESVKESITSRKKILKEKLAETAKRSSRRRRRGSSSGDSSSPDDEVVSLRVIRLDGNETIFDCLVTSTESIKTSWLCGFPESVPYKVSADRVVDVPGTDLIGTALTNLSLPATNCQIFYMISDSENRVRFLEIAQNELSSATIKDLSRHVSPSPVVLVVSPPTHSGETFFVVSFDPTKKIFEFQGIIHVAAKSDNMVAEIKSAIQNEVWGKDACEFFAHTKYFHIEQLEKAPVDGGMFIVIQKKFAEEGEENVQEYMQTLSNTFEIDLYLHDATRDKWLLGEVPAIEHALLPNGKSAEWKRPIEHMKVSMDVRNEVADIGDVIPGFSSEISDLLVFCDDPLLDEVKAGEDVNQEGWKLIDVIGRKGLQVHCAVIPKRPENYDVLQTRPICIRFFSDKVVEEGCVIVHVTSTMTISDIVQYCKDSFGAHAPCRLLEIDVHDCEIINEHIEEDQSVATTLMCWGARNILAASLRVESTDAPEMGDVTTIRCHHYDRTLRRRFGHPFIIQLPQTVEDEKRENVIRELISQKLDIPLNILRSWKLTESRKDGFTSLEISHSSNPWTTKGTPRERGLVIKG